MNHQPPDWSYKQGFTRITDQLFLGGEDDVDDLLYGFEESRNINSKGSFENEPSPLIDIWMDLRDLRCNNRQVFIPNNVAHIPLPFRDGNYEEAKEVLPGAKQMLEDYLSEGKRVLVACHQGRSRSVILLLWHLSETLGSYEKAYSHIRRRRPLMKPDRGFKKFLEEWKAKYQ